MTSIEVALVTTFGTVLASSGFWAIMLKVWDRRSGSTKLLMGLAMDRILWIAKGHLQAGFITYEDYQDLHTYLYEPYAQLGGDGTVEKIMQKVDHLPIVYKEYNYKETLKGTPYEKPNL